MKVYGTSRENPDALLTLQEVSFMAGPEQLRSLAHFFLAQARALLGQPRVDTRRS